MNGLDQEAQKAVNPELKDIESALLIRLDKAEDAELLRKDLAAIGYASKWD